MGTMFITFVIFIIVFSLLLVIAVQDTMIDKLEKDIFSKDEKIENQDKTIKNYKDTMEAIIMNTSDVYDHFEGR